MGPATPGGGLAGHACLTASRYMAGSVVALAGSTTTSWQVLEGGLVKVEKRALARMEAATIMAVPYRRSLSSLLARRAA